MLGDDLSNLLEYCCYSVLIGHLISVSILTTSVMCSLLHGIGGVLHVPVFISEKAAEESPGKLKVLELFPSLLLTAMSLLRIARTACWLPIIRLVVGGIVVDVITISGPTATVRRQAECTPPTARRRQRPMGRMLVPCAVMC
jgi:hypothetical protein